MESYIKGKRKKGMVKLLSSIEDSLVQFDWLAESLELVILRGEDDGIVSEMFDKMSPEGRRNLKAMFGESNSGSERLKTVPRCQKIIGVNHF